MGWPTPPQPDRRRPTPVVVTASPPAAAQALRDLLEDYGAVLHEPDRIEIAPLDSVRRGTVIYRAIQATITIAESHGGATMFFLAEDGNRWKLPPPPL